MTTKLLNDLLDIDEKRAKKIIGTKDELMTEWLLVSSNGKRMLVATPWASKSEQDMVLRTMRQALRQLDIIAYSLSYEAWAAPEPIQHPIPEGYAPSEDPNRKEVFMSIACDGTTEIARIWEIIRNPDGSCKDLRLDMREATGTAGRLSNLFK